MALQWLTEKLVGGLIGWFTGKRRVRVLTHRARFVHGGEECLFINVTNLSASREIEVTHVYLEFPSGEQVPVLPAARPLPKRLRPDETWETFLPADRVPAQLGDQAFKMARARLSTGQIVKSTKNTRVPSAGMVPGGPIS